MNELEIMRKVRDVYNSIAEEYDKKRTQPFPVIERLAKRTSLGDLVLDAGTGNGRHIPLILGEEGSIIAADISTEMLILCKRNVRREGLYARVNPVLCDVSELPFRRDTFTGALYSAVLHHLPPPTRGRALEELKRTLRHDSLVIITLWSKRALKIRPDARNIEKETSWKGDFAIPWRALHGLEERYYHLYTTEEARRELAESALSFLSIFEEGLNIVILLER